MKINQLHKPKIAAVAGLLAALGVSAHAQTATLQHYYYSGGTASITSDQVGTANGSLFGTASLSGGTSGSALRTTGVASGLNGGVFTDGMQLNSAATAGITGSFTIENWFQTVTGKAGRQMFDLSDGTTGTLLIGLPSDYDSAANNYYGHAYAQQSGGGFVDVWGTGHTSPNTWLDDGNLHQMALTYDGSTLTMYVDGVNVGSSPMSGLNLSSMTDVGVAGGSPWSPNDPNLDGYTYSFGIYSGALSGSQVSSVYALGQDASVSQINGAINPVPEPSSLALSGFGGLALLLGLRRRRSGC